MFRAILDEKRKEVERLKAAGKVEPRDRSPFPIRDFKGAISQPGGINLIAEIKFASPSAGLIRPKSDPCSVGKAFQEGGAAAVSLVTDSRFFGGDISHLPRLKKAIALPLLRKDFMIDEIQVRESLLYGADAVLLIARILPEPRLKAMLRLCQELGLSALTEIHDRCDLDKALHCGADIIGINNRNLETFEIDLGTTFELVPWIPEGRVIVSESGVCNEADIHSLRKCGIHAVLVGTSIMKSMNLPDKVKGLVRAGKGGDGQDQILRHHQSSRRLACR